MPDDTELQAWAYLARVVEPPNAPLLSLCDHLGPVEAAAAIRARSVPRGYDDVLTATTARADTEMAEQDLELAARIGARLVTRDDAEWPAWPLLALGQADTASRGGEPLALWVRGSGRLDEAASTGIALIGSRAASRYGEQVTSTLAGGLAADNWTVTSGGAFGVDGAAHRAALACGGQTMAVMACGIDRDYPAGHARLFDQIADTGLVVSEYPPGTTAAKHRFLTRNRLVAAMSNAVVVVEAGRRSGAANTAAWARKLGRPLGAVPGPVTSATSIGCHRMIADGLATLVIDAASVIALAAPDGGGDIGPGPTRPTDALSPEAKRVHDAIPARGSVTIEEIAFSAALDIAAVRSALARMDVSGHVVNIDGAWRLA
ncbi:DNA-protecting protein DprA [Gordonia sp. HNM0687]|uniref:DNA-protecting protein DprA n=1 Tax=Gordonia mangrovi TaxID=2665643 RepID=A0A6L7GSC9_9ACTN|nr:DNA-processing protein DprA [Gordonia mangrovi]MDY6811065.1 DNA-processing protein DprA [Actinomycetota bacterium]MXP22483.1 DNA-protecting protein DprA [Gordonia mangrovi]UVF77642.1 DNA-processing protein DprA [Gordonia mangrovi]